jgi:Flp pilus assembly protein TadG
MRRSTKSLVPPSDRGYAVVEFVLVIVFVMFIIFWAFEMLMMLYTYTVIADAAKEGVRYAIVHGCGNTTCSGTCTPACGDTNGANVASTVLSYAQDSLHSTSNISLGHGILVNYPDSSAAAPSRVQVIIHYPYQPYFSLGWTPPTINAAAEGRILN